jgi:hypothetical protein
MWTMCTPARVLAMLRHRPGDAVQVSLKGAPARVVAVARALGLVVDVTSMSHHRDPQAVMVRLDLVCHPKGGVRP